MKRVKKTKIKEIIQKVYKQLKQEIDKITKYLMIFRAISMINILKNDKLPIEIIEGLYIGSVGAASNEEKLLENEITHIVNLACTVKNYYPDKFKYLQINNLLDSPNAEIKQYFNECGEFIDNSLNNSGKVLVHW